MDEELIEITINYNGEDLLALVDIETANVLLNDLEEAGRYAEEKLLKCEKTKFTEDADGIAEDIVAEDIIAEDIVADENRRTCSPSVTVSNYEKATESSQDSQPISFANQADNDNNDNDRVSPDENTPTCNSLVTVWTSKGKPTTACHEASQLLLELRLQLQSKFNDKKTNKDSIWTQIVNKMREAGFNVRLKQVKQKFANLQKTYIKFRDNMKKTGTSKQDPPLFYNELHAILGMKDKSNPQLLQDTQDHCDTVEKTELSNQSNSSASNNSASTSSAAVKIKNRFSKAHTTIRPKTTNQQMLELLQAQCTEERNDRQFIQKILEKQVEQRDRMMDILQSLANKKRKRRRSSSTSSED